ncbi:hypothetical protein SAMN05660464_0708 [Geodermatophilus dictyosporus]|uniref:VOC domain-containing protein n=1 Tax=Geodermatophilus dictyosporus TaxID=1523247 RepID=A0A1I5JFJ6_9ACTN|nr:VOC family protein [Geodermatophilus dictyosporus]SFO71567.1 hypothetical protein SAMN05660464_0708 [Geodermatophilus dictyosporus]
MAVELFAGIPVSDHGRVLAWYEPLLGAAPAIRPDDVEAVWELGGHRCVYTDLRPAHAGHAMHTLFVDDLDAWGAGIAAPRIEPAERETYADGVRKVTYRDPDGDEIGFGGAPVD